MIPGLSKEYQQMVENEIIRNNLVYISESKWDKHFKGIVVSIWTDPYLMYMMCPQIEFVRDRWYSL
jgi:hypothetical protein